MANDYIPGKATHSGGSSGENGAEDTSTRLPEEHHASVPVGSLNNVVSLYMSSKDPDGSYTWMSTCPDDANQPGENEETAKYAFIIRKQKSKDSRKKYEAHSIVIQSPLLREALGKYVLQEYGGVSCELDRLEFNAPFWPFVHCWAQFVALCKRTDIDSRAKAHVDILHEYLSSEIGHLAKAREDYIINNRITWADLWMLFHPGCVTVHIDCGTKSAFEVLKVEYRECKKNCKFFCLTCDSVGWDGHVFGRASHIIAISEFHGTQSITGSSTYPLELHQEKERIKADLIDQGKKHWLVAIRNAIGWNEEGKEVPTHVSGRIVIDMALFNRYGPWTARPVLKGWSPKDLENLEEGRMLSYDGLSPVARHKTGLTAKYHLLCSCRVYGYYLQEKKWLAFFLPLASDVEWNTGAFDKVILHPLEKELITSLSDAQVETSSKFDDIVAGKGKGVVILLSGKPGVGKTLTAEATAERLQVPLQTIGFTDIGSQMNNIEPTLRQIWTLAENWRSVLLLDECEFFLRSRSKVNNIADTVNVSLFLRLLEYYEGLLFLTTNYPDIIDEAVHSRIHLHLAYPDLDAHHRRQVWVNMLEPLKDMHDLSDTDLSALAEINLNGRQIKNALKLAQSVASKRDMKLSKDGIISILEIQERKSVGTGD